MAFTESGYMLKGKVIFFLLYEIASTLQIFKWLTFELLPFDVVSSIQVLSQLSPAFTGGNPISVYMTSPLEMWCNFGQICLPSKTGIPSGDLGSRMLIEKE
jgi:hypothetical protein